MPIHIDAAQTSPHVVVFHDGVEDLSRKVVAYLAEGLGASEAAVVIVTPEHRRAFTDEARTSAPEVARAMDDGSIVVLDAAQTLSALMVDGAPDPERFDAIVGGAVRELARDGRPVRAYGEMVALLWDAGNVTGALALERLWNALGSLVAFTLVCAYPASVLDAGPGSGDICHLHTEVLGDVPVPRTTGDRSQGRTFVNAPDSPRAARHFIARALRDLGHADLVDEAAVVVTELATNAIVHARSGFTVEIAPRGAAVRLSVRDSSARPPAPRASDPMAGSGHGLAVIAALSERWGTEATEHGKVVWAELPAEERKAASR